MNNFDDLLPNEPLIIILKDEHILLLGNYNPMCVLYRDNYNALKNNTKFRLFCEGECKNEKECKSLSISTVNKLYDLFKSIMKSKNMAILNSHNNIDNQGHCIKRMCQAVLQDVKIIDLKEYI
jgi:hypothetical protein